MPKSALNNLPLSHITSEITMIGEFIGTLDKRLLIMKPPQKNPENILYGIGGLSGLAMLGTSIWALLSSINDAKSNDDNLDLFKEDTSIQAFGFFKNTIQTANNDSISNSSVNIAHSSFIVGLCLFLLITRVSQKNRISFENASHLPASQLGDLLPEAKVLFKRVNLTFSENLTIGGIRDALLEKQYELNRFQDSMMEDNDNNDSSQIELGPIRIDDEEEAKNPNSQLLTGMRAP